MQTTTQVAIQADVDAFDRARRLCAKASAAGIVITPRQMQCIELAAEGLTNREIAGRLGISKRSVDEHLYQAYQRVRGERRGHRSAAVHAFRRLGVLH